MKIAAFNIRKLGWNKVTNKTVLHYLIKIVSRYSVVLILEVVDKSGRAMTRFLKQLNNARANRHHPYSMSRSCRLGRDSYKEQFVFLYREDEVQLTDCYQYEDNQVGDEDAFAREPYILRFSCLNTVLKDLVMIPVHTKPEDSEKELDELHDVVSVVRTKWKTNNIMILGDFNADGRYVSKKNMEEIRIRSDLSYHWLICDEVDTTVNNCNDHTYDRIVLYGEAMLAAFVHGSAKPFNFQKAFRLSADMALSVSDHYPVEVELKREVPTQGPRKMGASQATKVPRGPTKKKVVSGAEKKCAARPTKKRVSGGPKKMCVARSTKKKVVLQKKMSDSEEPQKKKKKKKRTNKQETLTGTQKKRKNAIVPPQRKRALSSCTAQRAAKRKCVQK